MRAIAIAFAIVALPLLASALPAVARVSQSLPPSPNVRTVVGPVKPKLDRAQLATPAVATPSNAYPSEIR